MSAESKSISIDPRAVAAVLLLVTSIVFVFHVYLSRQEEPHKPRLFPYQDTIYEHAAEFGLDPLLLAALIENESAFDRHRLSPEGARGLTQIMPGTAREAADALAIDGFSLDDAWKPSLNIRLGAWYLSQLMEEFEDDVVAVLAAYNGGPGRVKRWQTTRRWQERSGIDRIPLMETRSYVQLVLRDYQRLQEGERLR